MHGVGEVKLEEYGPEFVSAIREYVEENNVEVPTGVELPGTGASGWRA